MRETTIESGYSSAIMPGAIEDSRSSPFVSPPDIKTPPLMTGKRNHLNGSLAHSKERAGSEPIDPSALSKALKDFEEAGNMRERTPGGSPSRKRQRIYGDRLVDFLGTCSIQNIAGLTRLQRCFWDPPRY
jgi:cell division cycle 20-like protein 1, cofactor of APC complex